MPSRRLKIALLMSFLVPVFTSGLFALDTWHELFQEGVSLYKQGNYVAAMDRFSQAIIRQPNSKEVQQYLVLTGQRLMEQQSQEKPIPTDQLQKMVDQAQKILDDRRAQMKQTLQEMKIAYVQSQAQDPASLLKACRGVDLQLEISIGDDPESLEIKNYLHSICSNLERNVRAQNIVNESDKYRLDGYIAYCNANWEKAVESWEKAMKLTPDDSHLALLLKTAQENFARAKIFSQTAQLLSAAEASLSKGQNTEAINYCQEVLKLDPGNKKALQLLEENRRAVDSKLRENSINEHRRLALDLQGRGQWLDAAKNWLDILELDPLNEEARESLDGIRGHLAAAMANFINPEPEAAKPAEDSIRKSQNYYTLGLISYSDGNLKQALGQFQNSIKLDPSNEYAQRALKRVQEELDYKP